MSLRYDKLIMGKDVFTYNEVTGMVELTGSGLGSEDGGRVSPTSQPTTPHHKKSRSKSSGRRKKLEKAFSTGIISEYYSSEWEGRQIHFILFSASFVLWENLIESRTGSNTGPFFWARRITEPNPS